MVKSSNKNRKKNSGQTALSICPTDGNGWCSYPFSPAQLEKRLRAKQLEKQLEKELDETRKKKAAKKAD